MRAHNFSAGPAVLPLSVLEKAQSELVNFQNSGSSLLEMSHRGKQYIAVDEQARQLLISILGLDSDWEVMFLQGGASTQFLMTAMNFLNKETTADYINTGTWSKKAIKEAKWCGNVNVAYSSEATNFDRVPQNADLNLSSDAAYVHFTSNNTIFGTEFSKEPESNGIPLICDASSNFLSKPIDVSKYGLIYAGAQKNLGPAGVTIVLVRKSFLADRKGSNIPTMLDYNTHIGTMFNTPPVYGVYFVGLVLEWLQNLGGLSAIEEINTRKALKLYSEIDADDFFRGTAQKESRSKMNVCFRLPSEELEAKFLKEADASQLTQLKGHRSVGGIRASIYNACPEESVDALVGFMKEFRSKNG